MLNWFEEAQFNAQGEFIYTYLGMGDLIATHGLILSAALVLFRVCLTFRGYIYTGNFGEADISFLICLMNAKVRWKYLFTGYHPVGIAADLMGCLMISMLAVPFWGVYIAGVLVVLLARIMRKRIAHKQKFIGNLKGEQLDD